MKIRYILYISLLVVITTLLIYTYPSYPPPRDPVYAFNKDSQLLQRIEQLERDVKDIRERIRQNEDMLKKHGHGYQR